MNDNFELNLEKPTNFDDFESSLFPTCCGHKYYFRFCLYSTLVAWWKILYVRTTTVHSNISQHPGADMYQSLHYFMISSITMCKHFIS